jgi:hypothetical protein
MRNGLRGLAALVRKARAFVTLRKRLRRRGRARRPAGLCPRRSAWARLGTGLGLGLAQRFRGSGDDQFERAWGRGRRPGSRPSVPSARLKRGCLAGVSAEAPVLGDGPSWVHWRAACWITGMSRAASWGRSIALTHTKPDAVDAATTQRSSGCGRPASMRNGAGLPNDVNDGIAVVVRERLAEPLNAVDFLNGTHSVNDLRDGTSARVTFFPDNKSGMLRLANNVQL